MTELIPNNDKLKKLFPHRYLKNGVEYSYEAFLQAVAQYPYFCNEFEPKKVFLSDVKTACKRELSTLLAHMIYESGDYDGFNWHATETEIFDQGLAYGRDVKCNKNDDTSCDYVNTNSTYQIIPGTRYFGRGSFHMRWNDRYAKFS